MLIDQGGTLAAAARAVAKVPAQLSNAPWKNLLWDPTNARMITTGENQKAAQKLLFYGAGGDLARLRSSEERLRTELAGLLNLAEDKVALKRY
jgi:hypothetical protein